MGLFAPNGTAITALSGLIHRDLHVLRVGLVQRVPAPAKLCDPVVTSRHFGPLLLAPSLRKRVHAAGAFPQRIDSVLPLIQRDAAQH